MSVLIPGSERFNSRPIARDELMDRIDPSLALHQVGDDLIDSLDPLTYEVIRNRLWAITQEMGTTLRHMSGSHVVTEGNDFNFAICDELGEEVQVGTYNLALVGSMDLAIFWTLQHRSANPGITEGDMFLCNDPWVGGGLHQNDAAVLAPVFHDGKLFCWTTAICHQIDLGGYRPGSFSPSASDVFGEAVPTPPIKVVRDGVIQGDIADAWVRRSRQPHLVGLDLRALVASNRSAGERILRLVDKYGADTVKAVMRRMMDDAERQLRAKLTTLPDGTWSAVGYQEQSGSGDRGLYEIHVTMTKKHDQLTFDFRGTSEQVGVVNCPYAGTRAGVIFTMLPILAGDIPWAAGGLMRCFDILAEEGTIVNATYPGAVSRAPIGPAWVLGQLVAECLSQMMDRTVEFADRVQAACCGTHDTAVVAGLDERGAVPVPFLNIVMDVVAAGYGARPKADGMDTGGVFCIPMGRVPDVEMTEYLYPLMTLWRREEPDTGGPGRQRGGLSGSAAFIPYGTDTPIGLVVASAGKGVSQNTGMAGGYPGNTGVGVVVRNTGIREGFAQRRVPLDLESLAGDHELQPCYGETY
ncbi:MAG: hydantoinase B/oxoprolinase family protein, partial [Nocardioidaceae bacterium]